MEYRIAIIGLGYVGLPLAVEFGKKYPTVGYDIAQWRIDELRKGIDRTLEVDTDELLADVEKGSLSFTSALEDIAACNIYIVSVPTPVDEHRSPNLKPLLNAKKGISSSMSPPSTRGRRKRCASRC